MKLFYKPLLKSELKEIVDIQLEKVEGMLKEKNITLSVDDSVKDFLLKMGYDVSFGARPLKRTIQRYLINPLAAELLMSRYEAGDEIYARMDGDVVNFKKK